MVRFIFYKLAPETVKSQESQHGKQTRYHIRERGQVLVTGRAVGQKQQPE